LGDFALPDKKLYPLEIDQLDYTKKIIQSLNGKITIIFGSHDKHAYFHKKLFFEYFPKNTIVEKRIGESDLILSHCPMLAFEKSHYDNVYHFHGHIHKRPDYDYSWLTLHPRSYDVGVDNNQFKPILLEEAIQIVKKQVDDIKNKETLQYLL
jgi:calcineurin-like phosphoesterase family protein